MSDGDFRPLEAFDEHSIAQRVRGFFLERGVPKHQITNRIVAILGLDRAAVYRRMKDEPPFDGQELLRIAAHYSVSVDQLLRNEPGAGLAKGPVVAPPAAATLPPAPVLARGHMQVAIEQRHVSFEFATPEQAPRARYVAVEAGGEWDIWPAGQAPAQARARPIGRIVLEALEPDAVALLEDDLDIAENLKIALEGAGLAVTIFDSVDGLAGVLRDRPFDAYICDWYLKNKTAGELISHIRRQQADAPIALTTGRIDQAGEASLLDFTNRHDVHLVEKPYRSAWMANLIRRELASRRSRR